MSDSTFLQRQLTRRSVFRASAVLGASALVPFIVDCGGGGTSSNSAATTIAGTPASGAVAQPRVRQVSFTFQTGWYAQIESAAVLAASIYGTFPPTMKVTVKDGGPGSTPINQVAVGQLAMCTVSADTLMFSRDQGIPLKVVISPLGRLPLVLVAHKELGIKGFADMKGHKVAVSNGSSYWDYLKKKYGFSDSDKATFNGSVAVWLQDQNLITQSFATNEVFQIQQQGVQYDAFLIEDAGYDAPLNMVAATDDFIAKNADVLPAFTKAVKDGMAKALQDPAPLFKEIQRRSPSTTDDNLNFSWSAAKQFLNRPYSLEHGYGMIDPAQMSGLYGNLKDLNLLKTTFKPEDVYTNQFVSSDVIKA